MTVGSPQPIMTRRLDVEREEGEIEEVRARM